MYLAQLTTFIIISLISSFVLAFPIISLLYKFGIVRHLESDFSVLVKSRKSKQGVPIMGGLIIIIPIIILNLVFSPAGSTKLAMLVLAISGLLGAIDDILNIYGRHRKIRSLSRTIKLIKVHKNILYRIWLLITFPWQIYKRVFYVLGSNPGKGLFAHEKIIVQLIAASVVVFWVMFRVNWIDPTSLWIPFLGVLDIGILMVPFIIFVVLAITNAANITDGLDGLSAGLLIPAFGAFMIIAYIQEIPGAASLLDIPNTLICGSAIGAIIAYLYFNIPPARFQMGDVGSLALGALLGVIAFTLRVPLLFPIIGFPFVAEVGSALLQTIARRIFGRRLFKMAPLHHHFEMIGWSEEKVVMRFWLAGIVFAIIGIWIYLVAGYPF